MKINLNGHVHDLTAEISLAALMEQLGINPQQVAVEVNLELVPREQHAACMLRDGDALEVVTLVGGG